MSRKKPQGRAAPSQQTKPAVVKKAPTAKAPPPPEDDDEDEGAPPPGEADLTRLALDRLAQRAHPELFMALQENIPDADTRWLTLFAYAFDDEEKMSPLLGLEPVSLNPPMFALGGGKGNAKWLVDQLVAIFGAFPARLDSWQAALSFHVITSLGEQRCIALGRGGMGEVVGVVETALASPATRIPQDASLAALPLDAARAQSLANSAFAGCLARARLGAELQRSFPNVDDEELDTLVGSAVQGLEFQTGAAPDFVVEARAPERPWLPLSAVADALRRKLAGGLRIIQAG